MGNTLEIVDDIKWGKQWILEEIRRIASELGIDIKSETNAEPFIVWKVTITPGNGSSFILAFYYEGIGKLRESALVKENCMRVKFKLFIELSLRYWLQYKSVPDQQFYLYKDHRFRVLEGKKYVI